MDDRYGIAESQRVEDARWMAEASAQGDVILCKDLAIARNQIEAEAVFRSDARVFGLANANMTVPDAAGRPIRFGAEIDAMAVA